MIETRFPTGRLEWTRMRRILLGAICIAAVGTIVHPAGSPTPLMIRVVTMEGATGPAYYSAIEEGFRFVGGAPLGRTERVATNAAPSDEMDGVDRSERLVSR